MNNVTLIGTFTNDKMFSVPRNSGTEDLIPIYLPSYLNTNLIGRKKITGEFRSYDTSQRHLQLYVYVNSVEDTEEEFFNECCIDGYVCKSVINRMTPLGKEITDILLAVPHENNVSSYIPCVTWGSVARKSSTLKISDHINIVGRIQSRQYQKNGTAKTAFELSVNNLEVG